MDQVTKMTNKVKRMGFGHKELTFCWFGRERERERERERDRNPNLYLQCTKFYESEFVGLRTKVHLHDKGYAWVPKTWNFVEDSSE